MQKYLQWIVGLLILCTVGMQATLVNAAPMTEISAGGYHSTYIDSSGTLWAWGQNDSGQVGNGRTSTVSSPEAILNNAVAVSTGTSHTVAILSDGTLWSWGNNEFGQLGDGTKTDRTYPVKIMSNVKEVSAGLYFTLALKNDNSLWVWGRNDSGQLGTGTKTDRSTPYKLATGVKTISAGAYHSLFTKTNNSLWACGLNTDGQLGDKTTISRLTPVQIATNVSKISGGRYHTLFVKTNGSLWATGRNSNGQLGDGSFISSNTPIQVLTSVTSISAGRFYSAAIRSNKTLYVWGSNQYGQLGDKTTTNKNTPTQVLSSVSSVSCSYHTMAVKTNGDLYVWGYNGYYQVGNGSTSNRLYPEQIEIEKQYPPTGIKLDKTKMILDIGYTERLTATITPSYASNQTVAWKSSNTAVAEVTSTGIVRAKAYGFATITATTYDGKYKSECLLTVAKSIKTTGVSLDKTTVTLKPNKTKKLFATVQPSDATDKSVTWKSNNTSVATVSAKGTITARAVGSAVITVSTTEGNNQAICLVTVTNDVPVTKVALNKTSTTLEVGKKEKLLPTITPSNATRQSVTWKSNKPKVASVNTLGTVTAVSEGKAKITATTKDGNKTATCTVQVISKKAVTGVTLNKTELYLEPKQTEKLTAQIIPSDAGNQKVTWKSDNTAVANITSNGKITAKSEGVAVITVKTADGKYTAACLVTVSKNIPVAGIALNKPTLSIKVGKTKKLVVTVLPEDATNQSITWSSDNTAVATVNSKGTVTAREAGYATITVTAKDNKKQATCLVTVKK